MMMKPSSSLNHSNSKKIRIKIRWVDLKINAYIGTSVLAVSDFVLYYGMSYLSVHVFSRYTKDGAGSRHAVLREHDGGRVHAVRVRDVANGAARARQRDRAPLLQPRHHAVPFHHTPCMLPFINNEL
jgi:hypothetical protein